MAGRSDPSQDASQILGRLCRLIIAAARCETPERLRFHVLNETHALCPYDRAILWTERRGRARLAGVSGHATVNADTDFAQRRRELVESLQEPGVVHRVGPGELTDNGAEVWSAVEAEQEGGLRAVWLPLVARGRRVGGLWLERWGEEEWSEDEIGLLEALADGYGAAYEKFMRGSRLVALRPAGTAGWVLWGVAVAVAAYLLVLHPFRVRVTAPCRVVAREPEAVAAPLAGVVERVAVEPGQQVRAGELLFRYDPRVVRQELKVARQQVEVIQARLERERARAFEDAAALRELRILEHRLEQERARLELAEENAGRLEVRAEAGGIVMMEDPQAWRGRPVRVGERVMEILDPDRTRVRLWIPEGDRVAFAEEVPVEVFLHVAPQKSYAAELEYLAPKATLSPQRLQSFVAEAAWRGAAPEEGLGLRGSAVLYGPEASLLYVLFRKPLTAVRRTLGL
jgi:hypothetical protein